MLTEVNVARRQEARNCFCLLLAIAALLLFWTFLSWPVSMLSMATGLIPCEWHLFIWMWYFCYNGEDRRRACAVLSAFNLVTTFILFLIATAGNRSDFTVNSATSAINLLPWLNAGSMFCGAFVGCGIVLRRHCCGCCQSACCQRAEEEVHFLCSDDD